MALTLSIYKFTNKEMFYFIKTKNNNIINFILYFPLNQYYYYKLNITYKNSYKEYFSNILIVI